MISEAEGGSIAAPAKERIHVGGLGEHVTEADLQKILSSIGARVDSVDIIRTKGRSFAYIDFVPNSDKVLAKLFSTYNGCVWKGGKLRLERAKEDYLTRRRREWAEDVEVAETTSGEPSKGNDADKSISSPDKASKKLPISEKKQLQMFFPRLRKMKSLPFSGTGKHKYSFQRVQVPSCPVHFCDCEEHAVPFHAEADKHTTSILAQNGGVDEEEFDIMNTVMNKLFRRESESNLGTEPGLAEEENQSHESKSDAETDEDNLIMNMVTSSTPTFVGVLEQERNSRNKELKFNKRQASKDWSAENSRKVQKRDLVTPEKKIKSLPRGQASDQEIVSALPGSKGNMESQSTESDMGAQSSKPQLGVQQSTTNYSWSQKNSWKELIGNRDNTTFSVSKILPGVGSAKDDPHQKSSKVQKGGTLSPKKKRKSLVSTLNNNGEAVSAIPESKSNMLNLSNESEMLLDGQSIEPELGIKQLSSDFSQSQKFSSGNLVDDKDNRTSSDTKVLPGTDSANKEQRRPDHPSVLVSTENKSQKVESHDKVDGEVGVTLKQEAVVDSQPTKQDTGSNKSGRGAAWLKKFSWTEMIRDSDTTFSMSQILPGISSEKQESLETKNVDLTYSMGSKHCDLSDQGRSESIKDAHKAPEGGKASILPADVAATDTLPSFNVLHSGPGKKLQTISGNPQAPTSFSEENFDSTLKATPQDDSLIGETCSFMRSTASLKEWANTKAALSKRKGKEK